MNSTSIIIESASKYIASSEYVDLLERMNGIHSTGLALANVFIAILACTLTVASISVAIIIWHSSREQKEERRKIHLEHEAQLAEQYQLLMATYEERIQELVEKVENIADDARGAGDGVATTRHELEELVAEYKEKINAVKEKTSSPITSHLKDDIPTVKHMLRSYVSSAAFNYNKVYNDLYGYEIKNCPHCGKGYKISRQDKILSSIYTNVCPHCGGEV